MSSIKEGGVRDVLVFDPRQGQWLARLYSASSPAVWSPHREMAMPIADFSVEGFAEDWPYLNSCTLVEVV